MSTQLLENLTKDTNNDKTERLKEKKKKPETSVKSWIITLILDYLILDLLFSKKNNWLFKLL